RPVARRGYLFESTRPLFPFGHGLSYTTLVYSAPALAAARIPPDGRTTVSVEVANTGTRAGDEVVQLYLRAEVSRATRPVMELKGFRRVTLAAGERRTVTFELGPEQLAYHGPEMKRVVEPGGFRVVVGGSPHGVKADEGDVGGPEVPSPNAPASRTLQTNSPVPSAPPVLRPDPGGERAGGTWCRLRPVLRGR